MFRLKYIPQNLVPNILGRYLGQLLQHSTEALPHSPVSVLH